MRPRLSPLGEPREIPSLQKGRRRGRVLGKGASRSGETGSLSSTPSTSCSSRTVRSTIRSSQPIPTLSLSPPYTPSLAPLVARILLLGPLRHSSCFPDPFPSGPREGVVGVLSEGWRCQTPVAARTLSLGFLSSSQFVFSVPPSLRLRYRLSLLFFHSLAFRRLGSRDLDPLDARDLVLFFFCDLERGAPRRTWG